MKLDQVLTNAEPYKKGLAIGISVAFFGGLIIFGGVWALVIAALCIAVGVMLGLVCGFAIADRENAGKNAALQAQYDAASSLAYKLLAERNEHAQRAETAERALLDTATEKTALRAQLDELQANGTP
ncbi:hypothetical protein [Microbispora bryophytorum]|uniref:hypothetical protein n=1 Tax=Microbispora bryophytorum TaxID=1460882 RepID=UPI0033F616D6